MDFAPPELILDLISIFACLVMSAFLSASETAVTSLSSLKTKQLIESKDEEDNTRHLQLWLDHPGRVLATILFFNTVVNILASAIATKIAISFTQSHAVGIATGVSTFFILIFGEVLPKSFGKAYPETIARFSLRILNILYRMSYPVIFMLSEFANFILKRFNSDEIERPTITEEELEFLINEGESTGAIEEYKKEMISGVFEMDETKIREVMTPRPDIVAVDKNSDFQEILKLTVRTGHSRIPVYEDNIDHVIGIVFAKDLLRLLAQNNGKVASIAGIMREPFFVAESKSNIEVFRDLKRTKNQMAVVIDEHGGTAGIVSMEDLLEEIVGDIQDEFDVEEAKILEIDPSIYDVAGSVNISEFLEYFEMDGSMIGDTEQDVDTIAGLVLQKIGAMPKLGQSIEMGSLRLEVAEIDRHRIERLRVNRVKPAARLDEEPSL